jgi:hypothetical protein
MRLRNVLERITGISTPWGGLSWKPTESEHNLARQTLIFLDDRRVLFAPDALEVPTHCVESIIMIGEFLIGMLGQLPADSNLLASLKTMRSACRKFLQTIDAPHPDHLVRHASERGHWASWSFYSALGELRGVFGISLALMCEQYDLEPEPDLARILPDLE